MSSREQFDSIIIGGSTAGLVIGYLLTQYGHKVALLERAPFVGGTDGSFRNGNGRLFDVGLHVLDYMRSEFTTRLFEHVIEGRYHKMERLRAMVIENELVPYNVPVPEWPEKLRKLMRDGEIHDDIGTELPTRQRLAECYGAAFADLVYDRILPSYPSEHWHARFGVDESELMSAVYPWFCPRVPRGAAAKDPSRSYQDKIRAKSREYLLYPDQGGFASFANAFRDRINAGGGEVIVGAKDLEIDFEPETQTVRSISAAGREFEAQRVFWCAPAPGLCDLMGIEHPNYKCDHFLLGSFEFDKETTCHYNELLFGDPDHLINRASFPGKFARERDDLVQLEFCYPIKDEARAMEPDAWRDAWHQSLIRLGVISADTGIKDFDLKTFPIRYNAYGVDGQKVDQVALPEPHPDSNLVPVLPAPGNVNINTRVPMYLRFLAEELTQVPRPRMENED